MGVYFTATPECEFYQQKSKKNNYQNLTSFRDTFDRQHLLVHDGKVYIITIATGSEVKVVVTDLEGTTLWTKTVSSAWLDKATK